MSLATSTPSVKDKRAKVRQAQRQAAIVALQVAGLTQEQIAAKLGVCRQTITRDLQNLEPTTDQVASALDVARAHIRKVWPIPKIVDGMVSLGKTAKNEAVRLGAQSHGLDLHGVITDRERLRAKNSTPPAPQALFSLPAGTSISVTVDTMGSGQRDGLLDNPNVIDVTPMK